MHRIFRRAFATIVISLTVSFISSHAAEPIAESDLHAAMEASIEREGLPGVVWTIVTPDGVLTGSAGLADARLQTPLSPASRVQTGSIVKTLIATGVLRLVTEGRLTLDSPAASYLPNIEFVNPWAPDHPVLVRHLLDHTSGLDDARLWQIFSLQAQPDAPLGASIEDEPLQVRSRPGSRLSYSNLGYTLLGMVIEQVTGERYERYLDEQLLRPLGMHRSTFQFVSQEGPNTDGSLAMGHFEEGVTQPTVPMYLRPAGQFTTRADDMARLARFLMSNGEIEGRLFITPGLLRAMGGPSTTEAALAGLLDAGYGLGLNTRDRHGVIGNCHVGTTIGFRANLCLFPDKQKAFFIAFNADVETADYEQFDALLIRALGISPVTPAPEEAPPAGVGDWQGVYILAPVRNQSFAYLDQVLNFATVRWDGQRLHLQPFQGEATALLPVGGQMFRAEDRTRASHALIVSQQGGRVISDGFRSYEQTSIWRMVLLWTSLATGIAGIFWLFLLGIVRIVRRQLRPSSPLFLPFLATASLLLPIPLFFAQSFLQLGDLTPASALLAVVTGMLPLAMIYGLWRSLKCTASGRAALWDRLAMFGVLQWCVVLASWELLPLRLWS